MAMTTIIHDLVKQNVQIKMVNGDFLNGRVLLADENHVQLTMPDKPENQITVIPWTSISTVTYLREKQKPFAVQGA